MFQLRDYQEETINDIYSSMRKGNRTIVVQQPPRTGKTVIMSEIARRATAKGNQVLFVVHRKEIVDQTTATFQEQNVDMNLAQLGMVQTITRHIDEIPEPQVIFIDEDHRSLAKTYQRIIDAFPNAIKLLHRLLSLWQEQWMLEFEPYKIQPFCNNQCIRVIDCKLYGVRFLA